MPLELSYVNYTYLKGTPFEAVALHDITVKIEDGEFVGIMGSTGCGKSTLIQILAGLLEPQSGSVMLDSKDINAPGFRKEDLRSSVGVVFQFPECQLFETTVDRDVAFGLKHSGLSRQEVKNRVRESLELVGISYEKMAGLSPLGLSGGEKRRVAIAGILAVRPRFLILDEPIVGLDPQGREDLLALISKLNNEGTTIVMVSHNADAIAEYCSRLIILDNGSIVADGPVRDVFYEIEKKSDSYVGLPQVMAIARMLRSRGIKLPLGLIRYKELLDSLKNSFSKAVKS
ncbi:MAG TPA: ATP-binding cassette domain-containing protein [Treponemataceae bacterium]|nr:ATP-binding cassette domain-containing protein [Treponemataceae bacterium]